jgi:hypothetical protein
MVTFLKRETKRKGRTVAWDGAITCDKGYFEVSFADDARKAPILHICPFKLFPTHTTTILEGTSHGHNGYSMSETLKVAEHALEIAQFSEKCTSCNNGETYPKTPNDAT